MQRCLQRTTKIKPQFIHCCFNSCIAFIGEYADATVCPHCKENRYITDTACPHKQFTLDWPIVWSGPRPWVFWGPFWRPDHMVWSQNGSVSKVFFRPDHSVQSNLYRKMGTVSRSEERRVGKEHRYLVWTKAVKMVTVIS